MQVVKCEGEWTLKSIGAAHAAVLESLRSNTDVSLECSGVTACDVTGVQLIVSAFGSFSAQGKQLSITNSSPALSQSMTRAGLSLSPSGGALICGGN